MHDIPLIATYITLMFILGVSIGLLLPRVAWLPKALTILTLALALVFIALMATSCCVVKCDNCVFYQPEKEAARDVPILDE